MKAIVLSPGPSLARYTPRPADLVLGVNRAAKFFPVDCWICGDSPCIENPDAPGNAPLYEQVIGSPLLVSFDVSLDTLRQHGWTWRGDTFAWRQLESFLPRKPHDWEWCTFMVAIVYAAYRGATEIEIYGCDWAGKNDLDGIEAGKNRSDARWEHERNLYAGIVAQLAERGITVTRNEP